MHRRIFTLLQYILFLAAGLILIWWQLHSMSNEEWKQFTAAFGKVRYWIFLPVFILVILSHYCRAIRWKILMEPLGYRPKIKNVFASVMIGYLGNSAVPRLGEILRCTILAKYEKLKVEKLVGTIVMERTFDMICFFIFIVLTLIIQFNVVSHHLFELWKKFSHEKGTSLGLKLTAFIGIAFLIIITIRFLIRRYPNSKPIKAVFNFLNGMGLGFLVILKLKRKRAFLMQTLFIWLLYIAQIYLGFSAMEDTSSLGPGAACAVLMLATVAMIITPGGIGSFPIFVMEALILYGVPSTSGAAFGWLMWGLNTIVIILIGLVALLLLPYINKPKHESNSKYPFQNLQP